MEAARFFVLKTKWTKILANDWGMFLPRRGYQTYSVSPSESNTQPVGLG